MTDPFANRKTMKELGWGGYYPPANTDADEKRMFLAVGAGVCLLIGFCIGFIIGWLS